MKHAIGPTFAKKVVMGQRLKSINAIMHDHHLRFQDLNPHEQFKQEVIKQLSNSNSREKMSPRGSITGGRDTPSFQLTAISRSPFEPSQTVSTSFQVDDNLIKDIRNNRNGNYYIKMNSRKVSSIGEVQKLKVLCRNIIKENNQAIA